MVREDFVCFTIYNIKDYIKEDPNIVIDFIFSNFDDSQISYWKYELGRRKYSREDYNETMMRMVMRYWADKYYRKKLAWKIFKSAFLDALTLGLYKAPQKINQYIENLFKSSVERKENIYL